MTKALEADKAFSVWEQEEAKARSVYLSIEAAHIHMAQAQENYRDHMGTEYQAQAYRDYQNSTMAYASARSRYVRAQHACLLAWNDFAMKYQAAYDEQPERY